MTYNEDDDDDDTEFDVKLNYKDKKVYSEVISDLLSDLEDCESLNRYFGICKDLYIRYINNQKTSDELKLITKYNIEIHKINFFKKNSEKIIEKVNKLIQNNLNNQLSKIRSWKN